MGQSLTDYILSAALGIALAIFSLLFLAATVLCSIYVWAPISNLTEPELQYREHSAPILGQYNAFLTKKISVQQKVLHDDSSHKVYVFLSQNNCHDLATITTELHFDEVVSQNSIDPVYMLENSI